MKWLIGCLLGHSWTYNSHVRHEYPGSSASGDELSRPLEIRTRISRISSVTLTRKCSWCGKSETIKSTFTH